VDVTQLPFNRLVGLELAAAGSGFLVSLPPGLQYTNHLGTVHASALLAVAEAGSGAFLAGRLGAAAGFVPVVRRLEAKFRKPAAGRVSARAAVADGEVARWAAELATRGRVSAAVPVEVVDSAGVVVLSATVEWFIARAAPDAEPGAAPAPARDITSGSS
jgi:acyl-coenzyme A thioesterase PaaI-like protein